MMTLQANGYHHHGQRTFDEIQDLQDVESFIKLRKTMSLRMIGTCLSAITSQ